MELPHKQAKIRDRCIVCYHKKPIKWSLDSDSTLMYIANVITTMVTICFIKYQNQVLYQTDS